MVIDGKSNLISKTKVLNVEINNLEYISIDTFPDWDYHDSSTRQAS